MQINRVNISGYNSRVYFGKQEGIEHCTNSPDAKDSYELKRQQINKKYDFQVRQLLKNGYYTSIDSGALFDKVQKIEKLRKEALSKLDSEPNSLSFGKWNPLKLFRLK